MSTNQSAAAADALIRVRRDRVHTTMLIELLALLVFLAMGFAFLSRDEMAINPLVQRVESLRKQIAAKDADIRMLRNELREMRSQNELLMESLRRFQSDHTGTLVANDQILLSRTHFEEVAASAANNRALARESQAENAQLRRRLGRGGSDLPNCTITPGLLLSVDLMPGGGFSVRPAWRPEAAAAALRVPGVSALASAGTLGAGDFQRLARQAQAWGQAQAVPCGFRVRVRQRHSNLDLYLRQHRTVARYFYTAW